MRTLVLGVGALLAVGCEPVTFTTQLKGEGVIEGGLLGQLLTAFPQVSSFGNVDFSQNQDFKNNNTSRDKVKSTRVTALTLKILSPNSQDFGFLDTLEFKVKTFEEVQKVAGKTGISMLGLAAPNPTLALDLVDADLGEFVRSPTFSITVSGTGRQPSQDTRLEVVIDFLVGVSPF